MSDIKILRELARNFSVLYVEDDSSIRRTMDVYLRKFFERVHSAENGQIALDIYENEKFDLVITDISMPVMGGIEMISKIKENNPLQSVLVTSAHVQDEYLKTMDKVGVDGYIVKPFDFMQLNDELLKIVKELKEEV